MQERTIEQTILDVFELVKKGYGTELAMKKAGVGRSNARYKEIRQHQLYKDTVNRYTMQRREARKFGWDHA